MGRNPTCFVCGDAVCPGERRVATVRNGAAGTRHWACGEIRQSPRGLLGGLEAGDYFEVSFDGGDWIYASVEGCGLIGREYVVRAILWPELYSGADEPDVPFQFTDQFDIVTTPEENSWTAPEAFEIEPDWPAMEDGPGDNFIYDQHHIGTVEVRPVDLTRSQYDWDFWTQRPTDPIDLHVLYVEKERTIAEIADHYDMSGWTIRDWLDRAGIERRPQAHLRCSDR